MAVDDDPSVLWAIRFDFVNRVTLVAIRSTKHTYMMLTNQGACVRLALAAAKSTSSHLYCRSMYQAVRFVLISWSSGVSKTVGPIVDIYKHKRDLRTRKVVDLGGDGHKVHGAQVEGVPPAVIFIYAIEGHEPHIAKTAAIGSSARTSCWAQGRCTTRWARPRPRRACCGSAVLWVVGFE